MPQTFNYRMMARYTIKAAHTGFVGTLSSESKHAIGVVANATCWVDDYFDALPNSGKGAAATEIISFLNQGDRLSFPASSEIFLALADLKEVLDGLPLQRKELFLESVAKIFSYGKILTSTESAAEYTAVRTAEAERSADMFLLVADELYSDKAFTTFYRSAAVIRNFVDTVEDYGEDKKDGKVVVKPIRLCFSLAKAVLKRVPRMIKDHPNKAKLVGFLMDWGTRKCPYRGGCSNAMDVSPVRRRSSRQVVPVPQAKTNSNP